MRVLILFVFMIAAFSALLSLNRSWPVIQLKRQKLILARSPETVLTCHVQLTEIGP